MSTTTPPIETTPSVEPPDERALPPEDGPGRDARPPAGPADASLARAALAHPLSVLLPIVLLVAAAVLLSVVREPVYTAESRLSVGSIDVATQAIPGVVAGTQALASSYSRLVDAEEVLVPVAEALGEPVEDLRERVTGSPIPESPLFLIEARSDTEEGAVELANLTSESLGTYVSGVNRSNEDTPRLLQEYRGAVAQSEKAQAELNRANDRGTPAEVQAATTNVRTFELRVEVLGDLYRQSLQGEASANRLQIVNRAVRAESDASSFRQRIVFLAGLAGLVFGLILAGSAARRRAGRPATGTPRAGLLRRS